MLSDPRALFRLCRPNLEFEPFHLAWFELQRTHRETLILAPRGHGKTTVCTCLFAVYRILTRPDLRILIVSRTANQAQTIAGEIRHLLVGSPGLRSLFGTARGHPWSPGAFTVATRPTPRREPTVTAMGLCGPLVSKHFDLILCDDVLDFENTRTRRERARVAEWVGTALEPTLDPGGEIHWVGTRYHPEDYYARLLDPRLYTGLVTNPDTRAAIIREPGKPDRPLWPARFTLDPEEAARTGKIDLLAERRKKGEAIFGAQYQNEVHRTGGGVLRPEWFVFHGGQEYEGEERFVRAPGGDRRRVRRIVQAFDPAISEVPDADLSAHVTVADLASPDGGPTYAVLEAIHERLTFEGQVRLILRQAERWGPSAIGIEDVAYQRALVQTVRRRAHLPVKGVRNRRDKLARAYALQGLFEDRRIWLGVEQVDLADELAAFPDGPHDDLFDALEMAVSLARSHHRPAYW